MKSIKEKATVNVVAKDAKSYEIGFETGANYVLDEVECILEEHKLLDCEEICNELIASIEQLKK